MSKGFAKLNEQSEIESIVRRLSPSLARQDQQAFENGLVKMTERYGPSVVAQALEKLIDQDRNSVNMMAHSLPPAAREELYATMREDFANWIQEGGLRIEDHFRAVDGGMLFTNEAIAVLNQRADVTPLDLDVGNDSVVEAGLRRDLKDAGFLHPLSEMHRDGEQIGYGSYLVASLMISVANGWMHGEADKSLSALKTAVSQVAPTIDTERLLFRARYCDKSLLRLTNLIVQGLETDTFRVFAQ
ncbi:MAG: hypothetical protein KME10_24870 [Plectolyngbya sp. WJT66-NPBG17]|jgi:hypothetical protein|nr:hypothetical protein [Plectolyngbya sp. WJT66-NPBG17]